MIPVEQFFAEYVRERTAFYQTEIELLAPLRQRFFAPECLYDSRQGMVEHSKAERILSVSQSDGEGILELVRPLTLNSPLVVVAPSELRQSEPEILASGRAWSGPILPHWLRGVTGLDHAIG